MDECHEPDKYIFVKKKIFSKTYDATIAYFLFNVFNIAGYYVASWYSALYWKFKQGHSENVLIALEYGIT